MKDEIFTYKDNYDIHDFHSHPKAIKYKINENGCWICISHVYDKDGYPKLNRNGHYLRMSRYVYEKEIGKIPEGMFIMHKCDNPNCINPEHLMPGTNYDNMQDRNRKGRQAKGEKNGGGHKLTNKDVINILCDKRHYREIAKDYNVNISIIGSIKRRQLWKHIVIPAS